MTTLLLAVAVYTILGGMLSVLITDFLQFIVMSAGLLITTLFILHKVGWGTLVNTVQNHHGSGGFNPFRNENMGWSYVVFNAMLATAGVITWQPMIARVLAAKDSKTGQRVYTRTSFFFVARFLVPGLWGIAALAILSPQEIGDNSLLAMPTMIRQLLPAGLLGLLVAAMLAAEMSTDSAYMLTWGSIIYNDIMAPLRRDNTWSERKGLFWNRTIVALIGVFLLIYGLWYKIEGDAWTYLCLTGTIYLSSISVLLVACCYWKRANSWGAAAAIICGAFLPVTTLILQKVGPWTDWFQKRDTLCGVITYVAVAIAMIIGSYHKPQSRLIVTEAK